MIIGALVEVCRPFPRTTTNRNIAQPTATMSRGTAIAPKRRTDTVDLPERRDQKAGAREYPYDESHQDEQSAAPYPLERRIVLMVPESVKLARPRSEQVSGPKEPGWVLANKTLVATPEEVVRKAI
jgi:hypothetical protein